MPGSHVLRASLPRTGLIRTINKKRKGRRNSSAVKSTGAYQSKAGKRPAILPECGPEVHSAEDAKHTHPAQGASDPGPTSQPRPEPLRKGQGPARPKVCTAWVWKPREFVTTKEPDASQDPCPVGSQTHRPHAPTGFLFL